MSFNPSAPPSTSKREVIPEGLYPARCSRIIELGIHPGFEGKNSAQKAVVAFNITNQFVNVNGEEKQKMISNAYGITLSNNEKSTMYQYTKALNPSANALGDFLGKPCMVSIVHYKKKDGTVGDKIDMITKPMAGIEIAPLDIDAWWFRFDQPDLKLWELIPKFQQEIIESAENFKGSAAERVVKGLGTQQDVDLPF